MGLLVSRSRGGRLLAREPLALMPSCAAMVTNSGSESAIILRIKLPRCALTVISLMPSSLPTCLLSRPATTNSITSLSRRLNDASRFRSWFRCTSWPNAARLRSSALPMALMSTSSLSGLVKNSTAPAFMA